MPPLHIGVGQKIAATALVVRQTSSPFSTSAISLTDVIERTPHSMSDTEPNKQPDWKSLFEAAMLELDLASVPKKIEEAKAAISRRLSALQTQEVPDEQLAMMDALNALNDLARMLERESQDRETQ
jgi:hypothetical protein